MSDSQSSPYHVVFVLGGPGSGKGTNCARIVEDFGFVHLSAGDLLRAERAKETPLAEEINTCIKEGKIVSAEITVRLLKEAMAASGKSKFLIDGFPRDPHNLECWEANTVGVAEVDFLLFLDCPHDVMTARLLERGKTSGRTDDNAESIVKRLATYEESTRPIIEHFKSLNKCKQVDSHRDPTVVYEEVSKLFQ